MYRDSELRASVVSVGKLTVSLTGGSDQWKTGTQ